MFAPVRFRAHATLDAEGGGIQDLLSHRPGEFGAGMDALIGKVAEDIGQPLEHNGKLVKGRQKIVTDGPFAETKDIVGGFTLVEARDLEQAVELSKGCPIFEVDGAVEVRPVMKMNM